MRFVVLLCCAIAIAASAVFVFAPAQMNMALIVAVTMLVCAQVAALMASRPARELEDARLASLARRIAQNAAAIESLTTQGRDQAQKLAEWQQKASFSSSFSTGQAPVNKPEPQLTKSNERPESRPAAPSRTGITVARQTSQPLPAVTARAQAGLYLEPVVRLREGRTAYYKASLQQPAQSANVVPQPVVSADLPLTSGSRARWSAQHDLEVLSRTLPVIEKLHLRRGATAIFVPLGLATLEDNASLETYVAMLRASPGASAGIVLDLPVTALAALNETSSSGLAWLAGLRAAFCLTGQGAGNQDLGALTELGFTFLDMPHHDLVAANGQLSAQATQLMQMAASHNLTPIWSGVDNPAVSAGVALSASLGRGTAFAAPWAVRPQAEDGLQNRQVA